MANERRLIDANELRENWLLYGTNENIYSTNDVPDSIDEAYTVDAVEVVRCKDCKYFFDLKCYARNFIRCDPYVPEIHMTGKNDFCSHGKRRGGASDGNY